MAPDQDELISRTAAKVEGEEILRDAFKAHKLHVDKMVASTREEARREYEARVEETKKGHKIQIKEMKREHMEKMNQFRTEEEEQRQQCKEDTAQKFRNLQAADRLKES
jgi:hypothetical protein